MRDARNIAITFNHARLADNRTPFRDAADAIAAVTSGEGITGGGTFADARFFVGLSSSRIAEASRLIESTGTGRHLKLTVRGSVAE
jgi:hypothetical protein